MMMKGRGISHPASLMADRRLIHENGMRGTRARIPIRTLYNATMLTSTKPGKIPEIKSWSMLTFAMIPYRMMGRLGGKRSPMLPDAVTNPRENCSGYDSRRRMGYRIPPRATMVTPDAPVNAVKNAHVATTTIASPPGIHPNIACASFTSRLGELLSARQYPANVNNVIAIRVGVSVIR